MRIYVKAGNNGTKKQSLMLAALYVDDVVVATNELGILKRRKTN